MEEISWLGEFARQWPSFAWLVPVCLVSFYALKFLALASEPVSNLMGGVGRRWRESAERKQAKAAGEIGALREEVRSLGNRVDNLQKRDEVYWAYVMYDEEWHRIQDFATVQAGGKPTRHKSFLEFRAQFVSGGGRNVVEDSSW